MTRLDILCTCSKCGREFVSLPQQWLGPEAFQKYGFGPLPPEAVTAFEAKFAEKREGLKAALVASSVEVEKKRMAGTLESFSFNDSHRQS